MANASGLLFVVPLLLSATFAGCLAAGPTDVADTGAPVALSEKVYEEMEKLHVPVAAPDGKIQDAWVFKPKTSDPDARFPVFINLSPYWSNLAPDAESGGDAFSHYMIEEYVPRGYAIVLASVRGTGYSEGCFTIGGVEEMETAHAVIDHFANAPWSNGRVGSGGKSYDGTTIQGMAGYAPHPALRLLFPVGAISELYKYNYRNGVPYFQGPIFNTYYMFGEGGDIQVFDPTSSHVKSPALLVDDYGCTEWPEVQAHGVGSGVTGLYTDYWVERDYTRYAHQIPEDVGFFYVHGFQDGNVKPDHILPWLEVLPDHVFVKGWLHQWEADGSGGHVYPMRDDWNRTMLRMMDHFLKGVDTGITEEPAFQVQDSTGAWRHEQAWPPAGRIDVKTWGTDAEGALLPDATGAGEQTVTLAEGAAAEWSFEVGAEGLHYAGEPVLRTRMSTASAEAYWVAQLWLENETGRHWMNEAVLRATLRESLQEPTPVVPGQMYEYDLRFYPQDDVFPPGTKMVLTLGQSGARHAYTPVAQAAAFTIDLEETRLEMPTIHDAETVWEDPQPQPTPCWAC